MVVWLRVVLCRRFVWDFAQVSGRIFSPLSGLPFLFGLSLLLSLPLFPSFLGVGPGSPSFLPDVYVQDDNALGRQVGAALAVLCVLSFLFSLPGPAPLSLAPLFHFFLFLSLSLALHQSL